MEDAAISYYDRLSASTILPFTTLKSLGLVSKTLHLMYNSSEHNLRSSLLLPFEVREGYMAGSIPRWGMGNMQNKIKIEILGQYFDLMKSSTRTRAQFWENKKWRIVILQRRLRHYRHTLYFQIGGHKPG